MVVYIHVIKPQWLQLYVCYKKNSKQGLIETIIAKISFIRT